MDVLKVQGAHGGAAFNLAIPIPGEDAERGRVGMSERNPKAEGTASRAAAIKGMAIRQARSFVVLFLYLWVLLGLFVLNQALVERAHGDTVTFQGFAFLNALVLAKVMLVIEELEVARWLRGRPLILVIFYEAAICTLFFLVFHVIERSVIAKFSGHAITAHDIEVGGGGLVGALIVSIILFVSLLPFFAFKNVTRAIGADRMRQILFSRHAATD